MRDHNNQLKDLEVDKKEQNEEVNKLKSQENDFAKEIRKREKERKEAQRAITAIIRREVAEARKRAEALAKQKKAAEDERRKRLAEQQKQERLARQKQQEDNNNNNTSGNRSVASKPAEENEPAVAGVATTKSKTNRVYSDLESTDEDRALSINFEAGKGRLPWPVDAGVPTIHFGSYTIPGTQLRGKSDGLTISVPLGASVKAVADGQVSSVYDLGGEQAVTIIHGKYLTTYSHLSSVNVSGGQSVKSGTVVGRAAANDNGEGEVLFMVTNERSVFLNPEQWLRKR